MKPQFQIRTMILLTSAIAIALAGVQDLSMELASKLTVCSLLAIALPHLAWIIFSGVAKDLFRFFTRGEIRQFIRWVNGYTFSLAIVLLGMSLFTWIIQLETIRVAGGLATLLIPLGLGLGSYLTIRKNRIARRCLPPPPTSEIIAPIK